MAINQNLSTALQALCAAVKTAFNITPSASYTGKILADDRYLLINTGTKATPTYSVVKTQITEQTGAIDTTTEEKTYLHDRGSKSTNITGKTRNLTVSADEFIGDAGMDYLLGKKFAVGEDAITDYAIYNVRTGELEMAGATINVTSDMGGTSGQNNTLEISITSNGAIDHSQTFIPT